MPRKRKALRRRAKMKIFAAKLEANLPRSEVWFRSLWERHQLKDEHDQYNHVWCRRIPDLVNHKYRYVIEIDGSYHDKPGQKKIDASKDRFYHAQGYEVYRLPAYNDHLFGILCDMVEARRQLLTPKPKPAVRAILRKAMTQ